MATAPTMNPASDREEHTVYRRAFDVGTQQRLIEDDQQAWHNVTGILITIVSCGLAIGIIALLLTQ